MALKCAERPRQSWALQGKAAAAHFGDKQGGAKRLQGEEEPRQGEAVLSHGIAGMGSDTQRHGAESLRYAAVWRSFGGVETRMQGEASTGSERRLQSEVLL